MNNFRWLSAPILAVVVLASPEAFAQNSETPPAPSEVGADQPGQSGAPAGDDEVPPTKTHEDTGQVSSRDAVSGPTTEASAQADAPASARADTQKAAAEARAERARAEEAPGLARRLEALAAQWQRVARALLIAVELEERAAAVERKTLELEEQANAALSLVEQTEARRARALARLRELGLEEPAAGERDSGGDQAKGAPDQSSSPNGPTGGSL